MTYPTDRAAREARRKTIRDRALAKAKRVGLTITCAEYAEHSTCHGAAVCLCECHDPREAA